MTKVNQVTTKSSLTAGERSIAEQYCEQELVGASVEAVSATHMFVFRGFCLLFAHVEQENVFSPTPDMLRFPSVVFAIQLSKLEGLNYIGRPFI